MTQISRRTVQLARDSRRCAAALLAGAPLLGSFGRDTIHYVVPENSRSAALQAHPDPGRRASPYGSTDAADTDGELTRQQVLLYSALQRGLCFINNGVVVGPLEPTEKARQCLPNWLVSGLIPCAALPPPRSRRTVAGLGQGMAGLSPGAGRATWRRNAPSSPQVWLAGAVGTLASILLQPCVAPGSRRCSSKSTKRRGRTAILATGAQAPSACSGSVARVVPVAESWPQPLVLQPRISSGLARP